MSTYTPSVSNLRRAIEITEQIEKLEAELKSVLSGNGTTTVTAPAKSVAVASKASSPSAKPAKKKRTMSPEARARIVAAQKARWAKFNAEKAKKGKK